MRIRGFWLLCIGGLFAFMASTGRASTCSTSCSTTGSTTTCTSTDAIKTPDEGGNGNLYTANIYPSCITVPSSVNGTVASVEVQLTNVDSNGTGNYFSAQGTEILLVSPSGAQLEILGGPGDGSDTMTGLTMQIANGSGFNPMPNGNPAGFPASGTQKYEPSAYEQGYGGFFPSPGPGDVEHYPQTDGTATLTSIFAANGGVTAAGTWDLWMIDNFGDPVTVNGWQLILTVNASEVGTTTTISSNQQPAYNASPNNSVTFTATVTASGNPVTAGTVAFYANGSSAAISCSSGNQTLNGSGQATCGTTLTAGSTAQCTSSTLPAWPTVCQGNNVIVATYSGSGSYTGSSSSDFDQLVTVHSTNPSGTQWCNNGPFAVPEGVTPLAYPSIINVSGVSNTVANVTVALTGVAGQVAGIPGQFLLVAPDGTHNLDFLDEAFFAGGATSAVNLTFFDTAGQTPAGLQPTSGNYEAYDANPNPQDTFPTSNSPSVDSSVPQVPGTINYADPRGGTSIVNFGEAFSGAAANGDWSLYTYTTESLTVNGGWCITFSLNNGAVTATSLISSQPRATTGHAVTFTASVTSGGNPVTSGTVTFEDNGLTPAGTVGGDNVVTLNGSGQATFTTSALAEGDHNMMASYSGVSGTYDPSSNSLYQRVDDATTVSNVTGTGAQFCNTGGVTSPNRALGAFSPNPSNIFVSNLWGTVSAVTVTLDGWDIPDQDVELYSVESLLAGPQAALDFFSVTDGTAQVSTGNYTFSDTGSALNTSNVAPGTYKPVSDDSTADAFFQDPGNFYTLPSSFQYAATHGSATLTSVFGSSNPNGTWSLYFNQTASATTGATSGWCLNFTENPATVTATTESTDSFTQGQQGAQFTVNIKNTGSGPTGDPTSGSNPLKVIDALNSAFTFVGTGSEGWSCGVSGQTVTCTNDGAVAPGASYPALTLNINVSATSTPGQVTNAFNVAGGAGVTATSSNTDTVTIVPAPKLAVQKTHSGTFTQGQTAQWDISVTNAATGGATSGTVTVSDALPSGYTVANFGTTSSSWACGSTTSSNIATVTCTSTLSVSGGSGYPLIEAIVNVPANSPTSVSNTALAWGGGDLTHTNSGNAASGSDNNVPVTQTPASIAATGGTPQSTNIGTTFPLPLQATVLDGGNKPIQGVTVTFAAPGSGPSGTFPGGFPIATATSNGSGVATSPTFMANSTAGGPYNVVASVAGLTPTASFALTNNPTSISATVQTSPTGLSFTVDNTTYTTSQTFTWVIGSMHTISTTSPQAGTPGTQYIWEGWSDNGAISHTVTAPSSNITYTASFNPAYQLTLAVSPAGTGSIQPNSGMFFPPGFEVDIEATANAGFAFNNWTGPVANPNNASTHVTVNAPTTVTANFVVSGAATLSGRIASKSGPQNTRTWTIKIANSGPGGAVGAQLNSITLTQSFGTACTPVIVTQFPLVLGTIAPGSNASGNVVFDFTGCPFNARFTLDIPFSANGGAATGAIVRYNEFQ